MKYHHNYNLSDLGCCNHSLLVRVVQHFLKRQHSQHLLKFLRLLAHLNSPPTSNSLCVNVQSDGNCDFRAIAEHLRNGENNWRSVKTDMLKHLESKLEFCSKHLHVDGIDACLKL
ncbi:hypothetical protein AB4K20DRAFT_1862499 [Rhizopus microsporus]|uniref:OTU domain-containing protein n=1 Tax=Rhizopus microsporus TaxID=58291 RepID=A0A1X0RK07_RHIZD|nr:hypothetical protein BCV71DRAFT_240210 [Rhizopus microsporus]